MNTNTLPGLSRDLRAEAVRAVAHPLRGAADDYDPLLKLIGDARFVLRGIEHWLLWQPFCPARGQVYPSRDGPRATARPRILLDVKQTGGANLSRLRQPRRGV